MAKMTRLLLAFGSNEAGLWGDPQVAVRRAFDELGGHGVALRSVSQLAITKPIGPEGQPDYVNAVATGQTALDADSLLRLLKRLERSAGRSPGERWGPRPLDIDILDFGGAVAGWDQPHDPLHPAHLVLPHPELANRRFVLEPLAALAPEWRHPVLGLTPRQMLAALG